MALDLETCGEFAPFVLFLLPPICLLSLSYLVAARRSRIVIISFLHHRQSTLVQNPPCNQTNLNYMAKSMCGVYRWRSTLRRRRNGTRSSGCTAKISNFERIQQNGTGTAIFVRRSGVSRSFLLLIMAIRPALIILK